MARVNPRLRTFLVWLCLLGLLAVLVCLGLPGTSYPSRPYSTLVADVQAGEVDSVESRGDDLIVHPLNGPTYEVDGIANDRAVGNWLDSNDIPIHARTSGMSWLIPALIGVFLLAAAIYVLRNRQQAQNAAGKTIFDMRKSNARQLKPGNEKTRFVDVGGHEEAKEALGDVVDFLKNPTRWANAGIRLPRGVLLEGPPGGGKTLLARAVAGEAGVPFFVISASEFVEMFVGVGAARIRDLFETAKKAAPAVVFIDEIDAVGRRRGSGLGTAHDEREQTLNQLLVCLDGFDASPVGKAVVVIAATNRSDVLDRALLRPGRFDLRLSLGFPDVVARTEILRIHCRNKPLDPALALADFAERTPGVSGATLEHLCNEAGMRAIRRSRKEGGAGAAVIRAEDFAGALEAAARIERRFDSLDALLVESTSQFTQPTGEVHARLFLADDTVVEGRIVWADATYIKILPTTAAAGEADPPATAIVARLVPKRQVRGVESLAGTSIADEIRPDAWAKNRTETA